MITFHVITLFPDEFENFLLKGIYKRAFLNNKFRVNFINLRDFGKGIHKKIDGYPYSKKKGMLLRSDVVLEAVESVPDFQKATVIFPTPKGAQFDFKSSTRLISDSDSFIFLPGYYEGVDERVFELVDVVPFSVGHYILNSSDAANLVFLDTMIRQIDGVLGNACCVYDDSYFSNGLECPQYTQPDSVRGHNVLPLLKSGDHVNINKWKFNESFKSTLFHRSDLLGEGFFSSKQLKDIKDLLCEI